MIGDLRRDLRLKSLREQERQHTVSTGDLVPQGATPGARTQDADGLETARHGLEMQGGMAKASQLTRATSYPAKPCTLCRHWHYDKGQEIVRQHGLLQVPGQEGGFLQPGTRRMADDETPGGPYDAREVGLCAKFTKRGIRLAHRFSTCESWEGRGRFSRWL